MLGLLHYLGTKTHFLEKFLGLFYWFLKCSKSHISFCSLVTSCSFCENRSHLFRHLRCAHRFTPEIPEQRMKTNTSKTLQVRECICFAFAFVCVLGKNPKTPKLRPIADDAITRGDIGSLVSLVYICGYAVVHRRHVLCIMPTLPNSCCYEVKSKSGGLHPKCMLAHSLFALYKCNNTKLFGYCGFVHNLNGTPKGCVSVTFLRLSNSRFCII